MFCKNCGNQIPDGVKFCSGCGTAVDTQPQVTPAEPTNQQPVQTVVTVKTGKGKFIGGIIIAALGGLSVLGSLSNDYYINLSNNGANMSDFITIGIQICMIAVGAWLIYKSKNK